MRPRLLARLPLILFAGLFLAACDSNAVEEASMSPMSPTGTWRSYYDVRFDSVGTTVDAGGGGMHSVRAQYNGRQVVTLTLSEEGGAVAGSILVEEEGFMRTRRYVDGEVVADSVEDYVFSGEAALEGTYEAFVLQVTALSEGDALVRALFGEFEVEFEGEWGGRGSYHRGITPDNASPDFRVQLLFHREHSGS